MFFAPSLVPDREMSLLKHKSRLLAITCVITIYARETILIVVYHHKEEWWTIMMNEGRKEGRKEGIITLFLIKTYISLYSSKRVDSGVSVRDRRKQWDRRRRRQTTILTHNFFSGLYHAMLSSGPYISASSASQPGATTGHCSTRCLAASLHDWPYLDLSLQIEDWPLQDSLYLLWAVYT